jgi:hypothetical protein
VYPLAVTDPLVAKQRIDKAQQAASSTAKVRFEESIANRQSYEKFYNNLALLSGGTIALSITYLGFLKSIISQPLHPKWLAASWVILFVCLVCAAYYSFFNTSYFHFARSKEYAERMKKQHETLAEEIPNVDVIGIQSKQDLDDYIKELRETATERGKDVQWNQRKEKLYEFLFRACALTARTAFVVGIALLLSFAVANINVPPKVPDTKQDTAPNAAQAKSATLGKDKVVDIPCVGIVTFPASMTDDDVNAACKLLHEREEAKRKKDGVPPCKNP